MIYDLIIIGSGAAGFGAVIYGGRYRMKVLVIGKEFGGETAKAGSIENYPGFLSIDGFDLMDAMKKQAENLKVETLDTEVTDITRDEYCFEVKANNTTYQTHGIIFAVGAERHRLGITNENKLTSRRVHYCVTCDWSVYSDKTIAMADGGDASVKGAVLTAEYVNKLFLIVRGKEVTAEPINLYKMKKLGSKIELILETEVKEIIGKEKLEKIRLSRTINGRDKLIVDGLFVEVGAIPNVELAKSLGVLLDEHGYIKVDNMMQTNIDGVFAAGDAVNHFDSFKQDITAAAMGAVVATSAYNDKKIHGELCQFYARPPMPTKQ
ncbi:MAG: thioredoxin reductase [Parcubacteria group bacterium CG10_big_fil_rev_8_21_14_0_10_41_35]|nr:MAG: thioredoxin reductase [Parcubacteria group bacterium CG10_big_fil_rev_8_21_14_0_10_41_35]